MYQRGNHTPDDLKVYNLYLRGRYNWNKFSPGWMDKAIEYYEQALEKDPNYTLAYAALAELERAQELESLNLMVKIVWDTCIIIYTTLTAPLNIFKNP